MYNTVLIVINLRIELTRLSTVLAADEPTSGAAFAAAYRACSSASLFWYAGAVWKGFRKKNNFSFGIKNQKVELISHAAAVAGSFSTSTRKIVKTSFHRCFKYQLTAFRNCWMNVFLYKSQKKFLISAASEHLNQPTPVCSNTTCVRHCQGFMPVSWKGSILRSLMELNLQTVAKVLSASALIASWMSWSPGMLPYEVCIAFNEKFA